MFKDLASFLLVGMIATAAHFFSMWLLIRVISLTPLIASAIGLLIGAVVSYLLNYRLTFRSMTSHSIAFRRFSIQLVVGSLANAIMMYHLVAVFDINKWIAQCLSTLICFTINFWVARVWVYSTTQAKWL